MYLPSFPLLHILLFLFLVPKTSAGSSQIDITDPKFRVQYALASLQRWYNPRTGLWNTTGWWNAANIMTMVGNIAKGYPEDKQLQIFATAILANAHARAPAKNPDPGRETPARRAKSRSELVVGSGYGKYLEPNTNEPITTLPSDWHVSGAPYFEGATPVFSFKVSSDRISVSTMPKVEDWLDGYYDDDLWWALAWINAYDLTGVSDYLTLAAQIFAAVTRAWPTRCFNGGIVWSVQKPDMNAIANELFLSTAAHLANRVGPEDKKTYVAWAERTLAWFLKTGMMNSNGTINDGLTEQCKNDGKPVWSYNQGVILGGLIELNRASPNGTYLPLTHRIARAAIAQLSDTNGIIHDVCEPNCEGDGPQFKGIFMRNLQRLHEVAPEKLYANIVRRNAEIVWLNDRDERTGVFGVNWAGPFVGPADASMQSSAMEVLVADVVVM